MKQDKALVSGPWQAFFGLSLVVLMSCGADPLVQDNRGYTVDSALWSEFAVTLREAGGTPWAMLDDQGEQNLAIEVSTVWSIDEHGAAKLADEPVGAHEQSLLRARTFASEDFIAFKNKLATYHFMAWPAGNFCEQPGVLCSSGVTLLSLHLNLNGTQKDFVWPAQTPGIPDELNAMAQFIKDAI